MQAILGRFRRRACRAATAVFLFNAAIGLVAPADAAAQGIRADSVLRLGDAYRALATRNPGVAAARALADATAAMIPSASLPPDPQVQLGFMNYALPGLSPMDPLGMIQLQVMQMIPLPGKLALAGQAARAEGELSQRRADGALWTAHRELARAFYALFETDRQLAVARRTTALLTDIEATAQALYRVGQAQQADVLRAQVELARMSEDTLRLVAMRQGTAAQFNAQLDRDADAAVPPPVLPAFPADVPPMDSLVALALRDRPDVRAGEAAVTASDRQRALAARDLWPDLAVGVQLARPTAGMTNTFMGSLMVGASIPVFARSRQDRAREAAAAMLAMNSAQLRMTQADTRAAVIAAYADLMRARRLAALYRFTVIPQADAAATSALASYRVGQVDFTTVLDDRMAVNRYEQSLYTLQADEGKAWADLEALVARDLMNADSTAVPAAGGDR